MIPFKPKKKFGQNFLNDENLCSKVASYVNPTNCKSLIEVGPGLGFLTRKLLDINIDEKNFIEIDKDCIDYLQKSIPEISTSIINDDFLKINLKSFKAPLLIVGNFPYNISNQILFKIYENRSIVQSMVGMFQYEVAERICSNKGTKKYGILSVLIQAFFSVELLIKIRPESFNPPPKVTSAVIRIIKVRDNIDCDEILFKHIIKSAFNQRRKTLRNSLKSFKKIENIKEHTIFDKRAEELDVDDYIFLTNLLSNGNI